MKNATTWFEIPTADIERATRFYEATLGIALKRDDSMGTPSAIFPAEPRGVAVGGCLVQDPKRKPGGGGTVIYLNAAGNLEACIARVEAAGGAVVQPHTPIGEFGAFALVRDTEDNVIGLHSY